VLKVAAKPPPTEALQEARRRCYAAAPAECELPQSQGRHADVPHRRLRDQAIALYEASSAASAQQREDLD
jgi:hypothetical protein